MAVDDLVLTADDAIDRGWLQENCGIAITVATAAHLK